MSSTTLDGWLRDQVMEALQDNLEEQVASYLAHDLLTEASDEEEGQDGKTPNKNRDFIGAHNKLVKDYFSGDASIYDEKDFHRRFRVSRHNFHRIYDSLSGKGLFRWHKQLDGSPGISPLVRLTACLRFLGYGDPHDRQDEHLCLAESTTRKSTKQFNRLIVETFGAQYLNRSPTQDEYKRSEKINRARGFPGCFASWDCKHFVWGKCPVRWAGQYQGKDKAKTIVLEAIADGDLYFWYIFFGSPGSLNDLNIIDKSSIVGAILNGTFDTRCPEYNINGFVRNWLYFLVDGIYPEKGIFVKTIAEPLEERERYFCACQEAVRKDIERAFGVLVQRFQVLQRPLREWDIDEIHMILKACIILHNMNVEERRAHYEISHYLNEDLDYATVTQGPNNRIDILGREGQQQDPTIWNNLGDRVVALSAHYENAEKHFALKHDLMTHNWQRHEQNNNE
jgi:hypothetical protein